MDYKNTHLIIESNKMEPGRVSWRSPSNLAIIKYWGKHGLQLPRNPSISFTLENAYTETTLEYKPKEKHSTDIALNFLFEGRPNEAFKQKLLTFLEGIKDIFPFLPQLELTIRSSNSFPHSSGIASSASSMSALALCLCTLENRLFQTLQDKDEFLRKASFIARLGSGSACRSVYPVMAVWGNTGQIPGSSDLYAIPFVEDLHPVFTSFHDDILIVSTGEKSVSSRAGHALMEGNPYAESRYQQARQHMLNLLNALKTGDLEAFGKIAESEALTLHALMMSSNPPYILIKPGTLTLIEKVKQYRTVTGHPLYFSLDAGPNLHLLYPDEISKDVQNFIRGELSQYCENHQWIEDQAGEGPRELSLP